MEKIKNKGPPTKPSFWALWLRWLSRSCWRFTQKPSVRTAWPCAAITPLVPSHISLPCSKTVPARTNRYCPPTRGSHLCPYAQPALAVRTRGREREKTAGEIGNEPKRKKKPKPNHISEACLCPTADSLQEPKQRITSTTGLDEEEFGFSSQTRAIGPIEIVHNLLYWNGFSICAVNASGKLNMAHLQEENPGASNAEGEARSEGANFPSRSP